MALAVAPPRSVEISLGVEGAQSAGVGPGARRSPHLKGGMNDAACFEVIINKC